MSNGLHISYWIQKSYINGVTTETCVFRRYITTVIDKEFLYDGQRNLWHSVERMYYTYTPLLLLED